MIYEVLISTEAQADYLNHIQYLGEQAPDLPDQFDKELMEYLGILEEYPFLFQPLGDSYRKFHLKKFRHNIIYRVHEIKKVVIVVGIFHRSQSPKRWYERMT